MVFQRGYLEFQAAGFPAWGSRLRIHEGSGSAFKVLCLGGGGGEGDRVFVGFRWLEVLGC